MKKSIINYLFILAFFLTGCFNKNLTKNKKTLIVKEKINQATLISLIKKGVYEEVKKYVDDNFYLPRIKQERDRLILVQSEINKSIYDQIPNILKIRKLLSVKIETAEEQIFYKHVPDEQEPEEEDEDEDSKEVDYGDSSSEEVDHGYSSSDSN